MAPGGGRVVDVGRSPGLPSPAGHVAPPATSPPEPWPQGRAEGSPERLTRIRWDVHDRTIQRLVALGWRAERIPAPEGSAMAAEVRAIADELRDIVLGDGPRDRLGGDLPEALRRLVEGQRPVVAIPVTLAIDSIGPAPEVPDEVSGAVYHIAREALGNALRHSRARGIAMILRLDASGLCIRVTDDGIGIGHRDGAATDHPHGGLRGMAERAAAIGARLHVESDTRGTRVALDWHR